MSDIVNKWIHDHSLDSISISDEELKATYLGEWKVDDRYNALVERLAKYYIDTESVSNKVAMGLWKEFKRWANCCGYSSEEISCAKRNNQFRINIKDES
jgi:hypothetical protein